MDAAALRRSCLSQPGTAETFPFGPETSVFKVGGRMFALSRLDADELQVSLKCEPHIAEALREAHAAVRPGWHLNKRHWNTVVIDGSLPDQLVREMIEDSWDLVVERLPVKVRRQLRAQLPAERCAGRAGDGAGRAGDGGGRAGDGAGRAGDGDELRT